MLAWWGGLSLTEQIFACIGAAATAVMLVQSLLLLFGVGFGGDGSGDIDDGGGDFDDGGSDGDIDGDGGLALFSVRGIVAFFAIGGWSGLLAAKYLHNAWAIIIAFAAGTAALVGIAYIFKAVLKLQNNGNLDIRNALGGTGKVYIPIPGGSSGSGKISIVVQERLVELDAVTVCGRTLATGETVKVCGVTDEQTVCVEPLSENSDKDKNNKNETGGISKWIQS